MALAPKTLSRLEHLAKTVNEKGGVSVGALQVAALLLEKATEEAGDSAIEAFVRARGVEQPRRCVTTHEIAGPRRSSSNDRRPFALVVSPGVEPGQTPHTLEGAATRGLFGGAYEVPNPLHPSCRGGQLLQGVFSAAMPGCTRWRP